MLLLATNAALLHGWSHPSGPTLPSRYAQLVSVSTASLVVDSSAASQIRYGTIPQNLIRPALAFWLPHSEVPTRRMSGSCCLAASERRTTFSLGSHLPFPLQPSFLYYDCPASHPVHPSHTLRSHFATLLQPPTRSNFTNRTHDHSHLYFLRILSLVSSCTIENKKHYPCFAYTLCFRPSTRHHTHITHNTHHGINLFLRTAAPTTATPCGECSFAIQQSPWRAQKRASHSRPERSKTVSQRKDHPGNGRGSRGRSFPSALRGWPLL